MAELLPQLFLACMYVFYNQVNMGACLEWDLDYSKNKKIECVEQGQALFTSTFKPKFTYSQERCMASAVQTYSPVFLATSIFTTCAPAAVELGLAPWLAPWAHRNAALATSPSSEAGKLPATSRVRIAVARAALHFLRATTVNLPVVLLEACDVPLGPEFNLNVTSRRVVQRAFAILSLILTFALTFGLAAPAVGVSAACAAAICVNHHLKVLDSLVDVGAALSPPTVPSLKGYCRIPQGVGVSIAVTTALFWAFGSITDGASASAFFIAAGCLIGVVLISILVGRRLLSSFDRFPATSNNSNMNGGVLNSVDDGNININSCNFELGQVSTVKDSTVMAEERLSLGYLNPLKRESTNI